jgi:hypothetical protein
MNDPPPLEDDGSKYITELSAAFVDAETPFCPPSHFSISP